MSDMNDRRPGMYYVPKEGMRYWDGESWSKSEPRSHDPEAAVSADIPAANRPNGGKKVLPWLVAGVAVIAAGVMAALLVIGGGASGALASTSEAIAALVSPSPASSLARLFATNSVPPGDCGEEGLTTPVNQAATKATKKPSRPSSTKPAPTQAPKPASNFDDDYARDIAGRIVRDIASADERMLDRPDIRGDSAMAFLSKDMGNLEEAGLPDVKDQAHYVALVQTLGSVLRQGRVATVGEPDHRGRSHLHGRERGDLRQTPDHPQPRPRHGARAAGLVVDVALQMTTRSPAPRVVDVDVLATHLSEFPPGPDGLVSRSRG